MKTRKPRKKPDLKTIRKALLKKLFDALDPEILAWDTSIDNEERGIKMPDGSFWTDFRIINCFDKTYAPAYRLLIKEARAVIRKLKAVKP